ncbi:hypothetical protein ACHAWF_004480 [Thalassiosira exigua]
MVPKKLTHRHHHHAPFISDLDLMNSLMWLWLMVVAAGFILKSSFFHLSEHGLIPSFSLSFAPGPDCSDENWTHLESHGDVGLCYHTIIPTLGLHAHRAVAVVDIPIEALLHVFRETPNHKLWVKDLKEAEEYHKSGAHHTWPNTQTQTTIVRHRYKVPLPGIADRELLMTKEMTAVENKDGTHKNVMYSFASMSNDDRKGTTIPALCVGCVRAVNLGSSWTFTSLNEGKKTKIELDVAVDPKIPRVSAFLVNQFQKRWPQVSLHGLVREARRRLHREGEVQVANTFFRLFPLWV